MGITMPFNDKLLKYDSNDIILVTKREGKIVAFIQACWADTKANQDLLKIPVDRDRCNPRLSKSTQKKWKKEIISGLGSLPNGMIYIKQFVTAKRCRGQGIGSQLMKELMARYQPSKWSLLVNRNSPAQRLYSRFGFQKVKSQYYDHGDYYGKAGLQKNLRTSTRHLLLYGMCK